MDKEKWQIPDMSNIGRFDADPDLVAEAKDPKGRTSAPSIDDDAADAFLLNIGLNVRARRLDISMKQADLAALAGCSEYQIRLVEQGKANPTIRLTLAICAALGVSYADIFP